MGLRLLSLIVLLFCFYEVRAGCDDYITSLGTQYIPINKTGTKVLKIGAFGSFLDLPESVPLLNLAANLINNQTDLLPDVRLELSASNSLLAAQTLINRYNVTCLIGGVYSSETRVGQLVSRIYKVPELAATPQSTLLSNRVEYPYLVRMNPPDQIQAQAIAQVFEKYNWRQALVFYGDDELGTYGISNLISYTKNRNVTLYSRIIATGGTNFSSTIDSVKDDIRQNNLKVIVIYTQHAEASYLVPQLEAQGYTGGEYIYIYTYAPMMKYLYTLATPIPSFTKSMLVTPRGGVQGPMRDKYMRLFTPGSDSQKDPGTLFYFVDAMYVIANAVQNLMNSGLELEDIGGETLLKAISSVQFNGTTGPVILDSANERLGEYVWYELNSTGINFDKVNAIYNPITATTTYYSEFLWNDGITSPSDGYCLCYNGECVNGKCVCHKDYSGDSCELYSGSGGFGTNEIIIVVVVPVVVVILAVIIAVKYNKYKKDKLIKDISGRQRSVIKRNDITLKDRIGRGASGEVFRGMLRGTEVAVKKIVASDASQEVIADFELECAIMAGLRHPNIVLFMGSCFVPEQKEMLLVMELMERGSLHDIIHNSKIQLTRDLLLHIAYQAAKGMNFLHQSSPPIIHRDLKSHSIYLFNMLQGHF